MKTKKKSAEEYIQEGDFEGALERFKNANSRWRNHWFDVCITIFTKIKDFSKKYVIDTVRQTIEKIEKTKRINWDERIKIECDLLDNASQKCYLFEFYNSKDELVCSKVGTTTRKVIQRLKEEMRSKTYKKLDCVRAVVKRVYNCGNMPAEGAESYFRAYYIKQFPNSFKKNDRFMNEYFDFDFADKLMENYLQAN